MQVFTFNPQTRIIEFRGTVSHYSEQTVTTCTPKRTHLQKTQGPSAEKGMGYKGFILS